MQTNNIKFLPLSLSIFLLIVLCEIEFFAAFKTGLIHEGVFSGVHNISKSEFENYLNERDEDLGWPTKSAIVANYSGNGYRKNPALEQFSSDTPPCLTVYGDSLAFGSEVPDGQAWPAQLTQKLGCRVLNYGVPGYGADQSLIRFEKIHPKGVPALFTFTEINLVRNRTQVYELWSGQINLWTSKPRFVLVGNSGNDHPNLIKIGLPVNKFQDLAHLQDSSTVDRVLNHEFYLPDQSVWGSTSPSFPYLLSASQIFWNRLIQRSSRYDNPGKDAGLLSGLKTLLSQIGPINPLFEEDTILLQKMILERFINTCTHESPSCMIIMLPTFPDLVLPETSGTRLIDELKKYGPISENMLELDPACIRSLLAKKNGLSDRIENHKLRGGHYDGLLHSLVADCLINQLGIAPQKGP
ncbi:MAG: hypothetical protein QGH93_06040 [Gammaproteobacteria bacterium]|jgi:hypothetical protein|nr:hypothetical protein [Gammaproteobacteria bacterium]